MQKNNKMKSIFTFAFLVLGSYLFAQDFQGFCIKPPWADISSGSVASADLDGDGDEDILINGSILFLNDGQGNFTEKENNLIGIGSNGSAIFSDVDKDGDQDVLVIGNNFNEAAKLFINDGAANFTFESSLSFFESFNSRTIAFSDVDGDNDPDILITGLTNFGNPFSALYINTGFGSYNEFQDIPIQDVKDGSIAFADVDGDNDEDVLVTGENESEDLTTTLYLNNGQGDFTEQLDSYFKTIPQ